LHEPIPLDIFLSVYTYLISFVSPESSNIASHTLSIFSVETRLSLYNNLSIMVIYWFNKLSYRYGASTAHWTLTLSPPWLSLCWFILYLINMCWMHDCINYVVKEFLFLPECWHSSFPLCVSMLGLLAYCKENAYSFVARIPFGPITILWIL
jgi:hypothetical protein